jgi:hypothetical protein
MMSKHHSGALKKAFSSILMLALIAGCGASISGEDKRTGRTQNAHAVGLSLVGESTESFTPTSIIGGFTGCQDQWEITDAWEGTVFSADQCESPLTYISLTVEINQVEMNLDFNGQGTSDNSGTNWAFIMFDGSPTLFGVRENDIGINEPLIVGALPDHAVTISTYRGSPACNEAAPYSVDVSPFEGTVTVLFGAPEGGFNGAESLYVTPSEDPNQTIETIENGFKISLADVGTFNVDNMKISRNGSYCKISRLTIDWDFQFINTNISNCRIGHHRHCD